MQPTSLATLLNARYQLVRKIGTGSQGTVFLAKDMQNGGNPVAVKSLTERDQTLVEEFRWLASISHPRLARGIEVSVAEAGCFEIPEGCVFFASEYVDGPALNEKKTSQPKAGDPLSFIAFLLDVCRQVASALGHLHARGIVHCDVKPDNLRFRRESAPCSAHELVLLDLGMARESGPGDSRGTLRYMAPEAFAGHIDERSDLYSLGISLIELATSTPFFAQNDRNSIIAAVLHCQSSEVRTALREFPAPFVDLLVSLVAHLPEDRPSSAMALDGHVERVQEALGLERTTISIPPSFHHPELQGQKAQRIALEARIEAFCVSGDNATCSIVGLPGSGRKRLVDEALLAHQIQAVSTAQPRIVVHKHAQGHQDTAQTVLQRISDGEGLHVVIVEAGSAARASEWFAVDDCDNVLLFVVHTPQLPACDVHIAVEALSQEESLQLAQSLHPSPIPRAWKLRLFERSAGNPGTIVEVMRLAASLDPRFASPPDALLAEGSLGEAVVAYAQALPPAQQLVLQYLAVLQTPCTSAQMCVLAGQEEEVVSACVDQLVQSGLVKAQGSFLEISSKRHAQRIVDTLVEARCLEMHRRILCTIATEWTATERLPHIIATSSDEESAQVALNAISEQRAAGHNDVALQICKDTAFLMHGSLVALHGVQTAELALKTGEYDLVESFAKKALEGDMPIRHRAQIARSRRLHLQGELAEATVLLRALLKENDKNEGAHVALGKIRLALGEFDAAQQSAQSVLQIPRSSSEFKMEAMELLGLADLYTGASQGAFRWFESLLNLAQEESDLRQEGRAYGLLGMVSQKLGQVQQAQQQYDLAAERSLQSGAAHATAVFRLNGATLKQRCGLYTAALSQYKSALRILRISGTPAQLAAVHLNRGNTLLTLGELQSALAEAMTAQRLAVQGGDHRIGFFAEILHGEILCRQTKYSQARALFESAHSSAREHGLADAIHASIHLAKLAIASGHPASSALRLEIQQCWAADDSSVSEQSSEALACLVRIDLASGTITPALVRSITRLREKLLATHSLDLGWKVATLAARGQAAIGDVTSTNEAIEIAKTCFAGLVQDAPEAYRAGLRAHPDAQTLEGLCFQEESASKPSRVDGATQPLLRLLALSRRLNSELRSDVLLDEIIDTAIELSRAERAFLLLRDASGELKVQVARNIDQCDLEEGEELSRTIAEKVANHGRVVMTVDAEVDSRFDSSMSVMALHLRSILAVPFRVKNRVVGTLYLDHRFRRGAFDEQAVELVRELADVAAVAIENARLAKENSDRKREIDDLNQRLETRLEATEAQLAVAVAKLPTSRPTAGFESIIGDSPPMCALLDLAKRAAGCALPVVISGESGTGKELLARAIHQNSDRREEAFVAINCGAVPESLLESELFGHRRGAFTGADRNRRGVFEIAHKGTLFLDEVADTSLAMQSKLLRVLQEGEIRPLGSESLVKVEIRILCASNKKLEDLVEAGSFREDLFYRLNVLRLDLPALRERRSDIAAIAGHILAKQATHRNLSTAALGRLQAHHWPGNIRELENELTRACAMADGEEIEAHHFSDLISTSQPMSAENISESQDLHLKTLVEELEQSLIEEAMRRCHGNQSKAAIALGLSRYGLQKKLQRYGLSRSKMR